MRVLRAALLFVVLALGSTACQVQDPDLDFDEPAIVAGNEAEQRAIDRHEAAQDAAGGMFLLLLVVVPLGLVALVLAVIPRDDRTRR